MSLADRLAPMTAVELLGLIFTALLLQLAAGVGWAVWRRHGARTGEPLSARAPAPARAKSDAAWAGWREFRVAQRVFEDPAQSQCSFYLEPVDGQALPSFQPGQFLTFSFDVGMPGTAVPENTRAVTRCYSLSDRPEPAHYRVTVKRVPAPSDRPELPPGVSSTHFHDHVHVGDILCVKAPAGHFFIDPDPGVPAVLIAGGIGITPMMSMLRWCIARQPQRPVHLFYGVRNSREHAFKQFLEESAASHPMLRRHVVYSQPDDTDLLGRDYQHRGHVDIELLRRTLPHGRHQFYVCGPAAMLQSLLPALAAWGVPIADIHHEAFGPASFRLPRADETAAPAAASFEVRFRRSARTVAWDGRDASLLELAERHGVEIVSGCRSGGCGSCETRVLDGSVHYEHAPDHDVAPGYCLLCVGQPSSSLVLEA